MEIKLRKKAQEDKEYIVKTKSLEQKLVIDITQMVKWKGKWEKLSLLGPGGGGG